MARFAIVLLAFAALAAPVPQQPYLHPRLFVLTTGLQGTVNQAVGIEAIGFERDLDDTTSAVVYAPPGTTIRLDQPPGTVVGVPGVRLEVAGTTLAYNPFRTGLVVADPAAYTHSACAPGPHAAVWLVKATPTKNYGTGPTPNLPLDLPIYIDPVTPSAANGFSAYALRMCFAAPDWPAGAVVRRLTLSLASGIVGERASESGPQVWHGIFTTAGAATVESQAILLLPVNLTLRGGYLRTTRKIAVTGSLTQGGIPVTGQTVLIRYGPTPATTRRAITHTNRQGRIALRLPAVRTTWLRASASIAGQPYLDGSACVPPSLAPGGCLTASRVGFEITGNLVRAPVRSPAERHRAARR